MEVRMSKKTVNYLEEKGYRSVVISLERGCSCGGSNITGLHLEFEREKTGKRDGYNYLEAEGFDLLVDRRLKCRSRVAFYLNESGVGNIFDIEGIEL